MMLRKYVDILRTHDMPFRFLVSRLLWRSRLCLLLKIRRDYYVIRFQPSNLCAEFWMRANDRQEEERLLASYLCEGDCMVDVGANVGTLALTAASCVGRAGMVHAFEGHPRIYRYLQKNVALNGFENVRAVNLAIGEISGATQFSDMRSDDQNSIIRSSKGGITVPMRPLDALGIVEPVIHLLKIDVEGYERFVLEGARELLKRTQAVYFESWDRHFGKYGYSSADVFRILRGAGFRVYKVGERTLLEIGEDYRSNQIENLLALRAPEHFLQRTSFAERTFDDEVKIRVAGRRDCHVHSGQWLPRRTDRSQRQ
jgi:FkbM family methyltransferase